MNTRFQFPQYVNQFWEIRPTYRSSCPEVFCKKCVYENFAKFTGKYRCQSLFFNKPAGLSPEILLKKKLCHRCFSVNFVKFLRTPFFIEHTSDGCFCTYTLQQCVCYLPKTSHWTKNKVFHQRFLQHCDQTADLVTFTEEILREKLHFLCGERFVACHFMFYVLSKITWILKVHVIIYCLM